MSLTESGIGIVPTPPTPGPGPRPRGPPGLGQPRPSNHGPFSGQNTVHFKWATFSAEWAMAKCIFCTRGVIIFAEWAMFPPNGLRSPNGPRSIQRRQFLTITVHSAAEWATLAAEWTTFPPNGRRSPPNGLRSAEWATRRMGDATKNVPKLILKPPRQILLEFVTFMQALALVPR